MENERIYVLNHPKLSGVTQIAQLVHVLLESNYFYHQELMIINAHPVDYAPQFAFPRDAFRLVCNVDDSAGIPSWDTVRNSMVENDNLICIGSHRPDIDRTFQLAYLAGSTPSLILRQLDSSADLQAIAQQLMDEWMTAHNTL